MNGSEFQDADASKPDWFILADADRATSERRRSKSVQLMAITAPLLMLGAGLVYAQTGQPQNAVATETAASSTPVAGQSAQTTQPAESTVPSVPSSAAAPAATTNDSFSSVIASPKNNHSDAPDTTPSNARPARVASTKASPTSTQSGVFAPPANAPSVANGSGDENDSQGTDGRDHPEGNDDQEGDD